MTAKGKVELEMAKKRRGIFQMRKDAERKSLVENLHNAGHRSRDQPPEAYERRLNRVGRKFKRKSREK